MIGEDINRVFHNCEYLKNVEHERPFYGLSAVYPACETNKGVGSLQDVFGFKNSPQRKPYIYF